MAFSLFSRKNHIVNIIITDRCIRYLELKQAKPPVASKWGERLLPNGLISNGKIQDYETLSIILEECVDEWKIRNRKGSLFNSRILSDYTEDLDSGRD